MLSHLSEPANSIEKGNIQSWISSEYFSIAQEKTVGETIAELRKQGKESDEHSAYFYVTDESGRLVGVLRMRDLLTSDPSVSVKRIMKRPVVSISEITPKSEVLRFFKSYSFLALPVVNVQGRLVGVLHRKKAGLSSLPNFFYQVPALSREEVEQRGLSEIIVRRLPWLCFTITTGLVSAYLLGIFIGPVESVVALIFFLPVVLGLSGSVGSQSAGIVIRGLEEEKLSIVKLLRVLVKELGIGAVLGGLSCFLVILISLLWKKSFGIAFALGFSIFAGAGASALIGMILPVVLRVVKIKSNFASGLFLLLICDMVAAAIYFLISISLLGAQQIELF